MIRQLADGYTMWQKNNKNEHMKRPYKFLTHRGILMGAFHLTKLKK